MENNIDKEIANNIQESLQVLKKRRTKEARVAMQAICTAVSTSAVNQSKSKAAKRLSIGRNRITRGSAMKKRCLADRNASWVATSTANCQSISKDLKNAASEFWTRPGISRPTGNKNDVTKKRLAPKVYEEHETLILEESQTDVFKEFCEYATSNQELSKLKMMCQWTFESLRPYYVRPARPKDRQTCCYRAHVEMKNLFKSTTEFRAKRCLNGKDSTYKHISELTAASLCPKRDQETYDKDCLERLCKKCGTHLVALLVEERDDEKDSQGNPIHPCKWSKFEYVKLSNGKNRLVLVTKVTTPKEMFDYMLTRLEKFPAHQFRANWQRLQYDTLREQLPLDHVIAVHDFSENYRCTLFEEPQSTYFNREEVTLHVTIIHRHRSPTEPEQDIDEAEKPSLITEEFFVISPDRVHDAHFVREARRLMIEYLNGIGYQVKHLHEFTDGCASQYKCRHTVGDQSYSKEDIGCQTHRNFFETSHAKGPQDAAGGLVKRKADSATMRSRTVVIQSAKGLFEFAESHLSKPSVKSRCIRRIFRYAESIPRPVSRRFRFACRVGVRKIHQVQSDDTSMKVKVRDLSCYSCDVCLDMKSDKCENTAKTGPLQVVTLKPDKKGLSEEELTDDLQEETMQDLMGKNSVVAVKTDEEGNCYYLIKVTSIGCYNARKDVSDPWSGTVFPRGSEIFRGFYYDRIDNCGSQHNFKLNTSRPTVCAGRAIMYLLSVVATELLVISEEDHLDIIQC